MKMKNKMKIKRKKKMEKKNGKGKRKREKEKEKGKEIPAPNQPFLPHPKKRPQNCVGRGGGGRGGVSKGQRSRGEMPPKGSPKVTGGPYRAWDGMGEGYVKDVLVTR